MALLPSPLGDHLLGWILVGLVASVFLVFRRLGSQPNLSQFPLLGKEYGNRRKRVEEFLYRPVQLYAEGYSRFKDQVFRVSMPDSDHLIVPGRYLDELRQKSDEEVITVPDFLPFNTVVSNLVSSFTDRCAQVIYGRKLRILART